MLKGYVQATPENVKVGQKCYMVRQGDYHIHNLKLNTFGVITGELELNELFGDDLSSVDVDGKCKRYDKTVNQIVYLNSLLVKEVK